MLEETDILAVELQQSGIHRFLCCCSGVHVCNFLVLREDVVKVSFVPKRVKKRCQGRCEAMSVRNGGNWKEREDTDKATQTGRACPSRVTT